MGTLIPVAAAVVGGLIGAWSGIPGAPLLGALAATIAVKHRRRSTQWPRQLFLAAQLLIGAAGGALITRATVTDFVGPVLVGLGISAAVAVVGCGCGLLLSRLTGIDPWSAVVAFVPGGLSELVGIAEEHRLRTDVVVAVHLLRRLATIGLVVSVAALTF